MPKIPSPGAERMEKVGIEADNVFLNYNSAVWGAVTA